MTAHQDTDTAPATGAPPSDRSRLRRAAERGHYDRATIEAIVDAAWICHIAFAASPGPDAPVLCLPTACWRVGDELFIHGANGSAMMRRLAAGSTACVTITHLDGLVLARSAFSHSMNYRSVVIHGRFSAVDGERKARVLDALTAHLVPGRQLDARAPDIHELKATTVLAIPLAEASAKVRAWGPRDKDADVALPVWAGVLPVRLQRLAPQADEACALPLPDYLQGWTQA